MPALKVRFGRTVRRLRERIGCSQERFADAIGVHRTHIGSIERGECSPGLEVIAQIAQGLGMPTSKLFEAVEREVG
jgi:transcriptional regulator with XRE-family HTH domain